MQSRSGSVAEIGTNVAVKFFTAYAIWHFIRPYAMSIDTFFITCIFTINSIVFGYAIRRAFNKEETCNSN